MTETVDLDGLIHVGPVAIAALSCRQVAQLGDGAFAQKGAFCQKRPVAILIRCDGVVRIFDVTGEARDHAAFEIAHPGLLAEFERRATGGRPPRV